MKKYLKNIVSTFIICGLFQSCAFSATKLEDVIVPKEPAYRLGTSSDIEKEYKVVDLSKNVTARYDKEYLKSITYADLTLKDISKEISKTVEFDKNDLLEDTQILWAGAATKSETIKFALYKLQNPDSDKPDENLVKKIVKPIAGLSSIAGASFMNPFAAASAMMGGSLANALTMNDKDLNYKFTKVNDADMIVLIRKVDDLQKRLLNEYFEYMTSSQMLKMANSALSQRAKIYENAKRLDDDAAILMADAYYRVALDNKTQLELEFISKRSALEQLVGADTLKEFESNLIRREKENNK